MPMLSYLPSRSKSLSPVTIKYEPAATAHSGIRLSGGSSLIISSCTAGFTVRAMPVIRLRASVISSVDFADAGKFKKLKRLSLRKVEPGDQDVGIGSDAQQSEAILAAHF
jgi:hypothetical protein